MPVKKSSSILILLFLVTTVLLMLSGCDGQQATSAIEPTTAAPTTTAPSPTPTSVPTPAPTPTPDPVSVFIPRDPLPEGRIFAADHFMVTRGEGAFYNVYDSFGKQVATFTHTDRESPPLGFFNEDELARYTRINYDQVKTAVPEKPDYFLDSDLHSYVNGFYQVVYGDEKSLVYIYNTRGKIIRTLTYPGLLKNWDQIGVANMGSETVVSSQAMIGEPTKFSILIYILSADGTTSFEYSAIDQTRLPVSILARKYVVVTTGNEGICDLLDLDGNLVLQNAGTFDISVAGASDIYVSPYISFSNYFARDGQIFDSSLKVAARNQMTPDGLIIPGVEYDVDGIICKAESWQPIAVGAQGSRLAIKTRDVEYVIDNCAATLYNSSQKLLMLFDQAANNYQLRSLKTGTLLRTITDAQNFELANEYLLVKTGENTGGIWSKGFYIVDKNGNVRYQSQNASAVCTNGEYIVLKRGPYVGLADLNGEWILKSLIWELGRDQLDGAFYPN